MPKCAFGHMCKGWELAARGGRGPAGAPGRPAGKAGRAGSASCRPAERLAAESDVG